MHKNLISSLLSITLIQVYSATSQQVVVEVINCAGHMTLVPADEPRGLVPEPFMRALGAQILVHPFMIQLLSGGELINRDMQINPSQLVTMVLNIERREFIEGLKGILGRINLSEECFFTIKMANGFLSICCTQGVFTERYECTFDSERTNFMRCTCTSCRNVAKHIQIRQWAPLLACFSITPSAVEGGNSVPLGGSGITDSCLLYILDMIYLTEWKPPELDIFSKIYSQEFNRYHCSMFFRVEIRRLLILKDRCSLKDWVI